MKNDVFHTDAVARLESFRDLKLSRLESIRVLKLSYLESIRALKLSDLATASTLIQMLSPD